MKEFLFFETFGDRSDNRFKHAQVWSEENVSGNERVQLSLCFVEVRKENDGYSVTFVKDENHVYTLDNKLLMSQFPDMLISAHNLESTLADAKVQQVIEFLAERTIYSHAKIIASREKPGEDLIVTVECFEYKGHAIMNDLDCGTSKLPHNLAGGIVTSSFIVDGSAVRTIDDLRRDLNR